MTTALILAVLAAWVGVYLLRRYPVINDVTTTPEDPPRFRKIAALPAHKGRDLSYPAHFSDPQRAAYPDLAPSGLQEPPEKAFPKVEAAARSMAGWEIVSADPSSGVLEAVALTRLLRFRDDVVIELRASGAGSAVHMRSRSRLGRSDFGANAARIRAFLRALAAQKD